MAEKVPLCKECKWFTPIPGTKKDGFCHKGQICERIVKSYGGQPKKCRREKEMARDDDMQTFKKKIVTNGDRIRAMTNEELAEFFTADLFCGKMNGEIATISDCSDRKCNDCLLEWLKKEV